MLQWIKTSVVDELKVETFERAKVSISVRIIWTCTSSDSSAPEISFSKQDSSWIMRDMFSLITPSTSKFDGTFTSLNTSIHQKRLVVTKNIVKLLFNQTKFAIVDGSRGQSYFLSLFNKSLEDFGMAVALIDSRICWKEIIISFS